MNSDTIWQDPPATLTLSAGELHVWRVALSAETGQRLALQQLLSAEELARAQRFHFERDRQRFVVRRGVVRLLLGRLLQRDPAALRFDIGPNGKPAISAEMNPLDLRFNTSHTGDWALIGTVIGHELGVDIEAIRPEVDMAGIVARFFGPLERAEWQSISAEEQPYAFFNAWTRKEAVIKATGEGLSRELDSFDVSLTPGEPIQLRQIEGDSAELWSMVELHPGEGLLGAVALRAQPHRLRCWNWPHAGFVAS